MGLQNKPSKKKFNVKNEWMHKKYKIMLFLRHSVLNMFNKKNKMESNSNKQVDCLIVNVSTWDAFVFIVLLKSCFSCCLPWQN